MTLRAVASPRPCCSRPARMPGAALRLVDDGGHEVALAHPARRIVALAPHLTELVYAAGAGDQLVASASSATFRPRRAASR